MTDYISRRSVMELVQFMPAKGGPIGIVPTKAVLQLPAADVKPVVHGKWIKFDEDTWECSNCGQLWTLVDGTPKENNMNYCPACGADMREREDNL